MLLWKMFTHPRFFGNVYIINPDRLIEFCGRFEPWILDRLCVKNVANLKQQGDIGIGSIEVRKRLEIANIRIPCEKGGRSGKND